MRYSFLLLSLLTTLAGQAQSPSATRYKLLVDKGHSTVTYTMKHPMHTWDGVSHDVNGAMIYNSANKQVENVALVIKVASFDTKNANRDSHAIEVLDGIKYPTVTFTSQDIRPNASGGLTAKGKLTFHGVTRPLQVDLTRQDTNDGFLFDGTFPVSLTDYKIEKPSLMMVPVEDVMTMKFSLYFKSTTPMTN
ncbi:YceI family protein [Spirosoma sp. SC4-14]|uniref:YceI family protein n=1 Tax=Spirosoma sp. SC4-14 TaxID=3128900 RepID=UPI0030CE7869